MKACAAVQGGNEYVMCNSALGALDEEMNAEALRVGWCQNLQLSWPSLGVLPFATRNILPECNYRTC